MGETYGHDVSHFKRSKLNWKNGGQKNFETDAEDEILALLLLIIVKKLNIFA